ncbi:FG-GAP-like repeat-containing protein [Flavobacterium silvaticum]|uniref:T9SS type A sorting domain-containing protein n=1 Tax=Flavobacterium silvaticum TaxID=1852020 RepID=A0A972JIA2_9FLAO|nr:FG-GAP-like repeat-containing protein [Flavobacterium silvaticum]NMH27988.1 T9SS type A sorting domain-containing protein [Flavobacterium silvaticum]
MNLKTTIEKAPSPFLFFKVLAMLLAFVSFQNVKAQNTCATAVPVTAGTYVVDAINGTNVSVGCSNASMAEWYAYTPTENHSTTVTSDLAVNICKDTNFNVYTGTCTALSCYAGDDDSGIIACNSGNASTYLSTDTFEAYAGVTYYIAWDNRWSTAGFSFQIIENPFIENPCNTATLVTAGTTTVPVIDALTLTTACSSATLAKWYRYVPTQDYHLTVTSDLEANLCKDTNFSVYTGSCNTLLSCITTDDNSGELVCTESGLSNLSTRTFDVTAGTVYYIVWDNAWSTDGFDFQIIEEEFTFPVSYTNTSIPTMNSTYNTCIVDMNNDGRDDIAGVSSNNLRIHFQANDGTLSFTDFNVPGNHYMPSWSIAAGDYNKDGYTDLLLGSGQGLTFWKSNDTGTAYTGITPGQYIFCQRTNFIDINNDGNLDAFSCHDIAPNCYYINDGLGNMSFYQSSGINLFGNVGGNYASIWTDYDNDGDQDMFVSKCSGPPCELHRNNGDGTFTDVASVSGMNFQPVSSWSSAISDFDNDGDMDILVGSNGGAATRLFRNDLGAGTDAFTNITLGSGWDTNPNTNRDYIAYDFDNDGNVDVLGGGSKIMFGQGDGTFLSTVYPGNINVGAVGDLNGDGFLDIIDWNTVRMAVPNGNNWVVVHLKGIQSNSSGVGARVEIYGSWGKQIRDVRSGEGFEYMSTLNAHFGLGQADAIDSIVIRWPSGTVDVIPNPQINQMQTVVEGSFPLSNPSVGQAGFAIYPNPAEDYLTISRNASTPEIKSLEIYDLAGRFISNPALENDRLSVKILSTGTYILVLRAADGKSYTQKFLKK